MDQHEELLSRKKARIIEESPIASVFRQTRRQGTYDQDYARDFGKTKRGRLF